MTPNIIATNDELCLTQCIHRLNIHHAPYSRLTEKLSNNCSPFFAGMAAAVTTAKRVNKERESAWCCICSGCVMTFFNSSTYRPLLLKRISLEVLWEYRSQINPCHLHCTSVDVVPWLLLWCPLKCFNTNLHFSPRKPPNQRKIYVFLQEYKFKALRISLLGPMIIKTDTSQTTNVIMLLSIGCHKLVFLIL